VGTAGASTTESPRRAIVGWAVSTAVLALACAVGDGSGDVQLSGGGSVSASSSTTATGGSTGDTGSESSVGETDSGEATTVSTGDTSGGGDTDCDPITWYHDVDGDGRGSARDTTLACDPPAGFVPFGDDCDDGDPARNPAAAELCDAVDNDCDTLIDEASPSNSSCSGCELHESAGHSYALCPAGAPFDAARVACAAFGGDLLRLDDAAELATVVAFAEPPAGVGGGWSMGLSDIAAEGTFVWVDGGPLTFSNWNPGEPNDGATNEDCAELDLAGGGWNDIPCADPRAFVCEAAPP
jgi:Lectin C-type domain/Putative metal-binding motif